MAAIDELLAELSQDSAVATQSLRKLCLAIGGEATTVADCVNVVTAIGGPLRLPSSTEYVCPVSDLLLAAVARHPVPACADAVCAIASSLPSRAHGQALRSLFRVAAYADHRPSVERGLELFSEWHDSVRPDAVGGVFYFLCRKPVFATEVLPALSAVHTNNRALQREIEEVRQCYLAAGLIPEQMHFPTLYSQSYLEELARLEPEELAHITVNGISNLAPDASSIYSTLTATSEPLRHIYSAWWLEAEVMNGGLEQYFWNSSGEFAVEAVDALVALGLGDLAELLRQSIAAQMAADSDWRPLRNDGTLAAFSASYELDILAGVGERFDELCGEGNIGAALRAYTLNNVPAIASFFASV